MTHKIAFRFWLALCCLHLSSNAQDKAGDVTFTPIVQESQKATFELKIGEKVPQDFWTQKHLVFKEGKTEEFTFQHLRNKLIIIDFWATSCLVCIKEMPDQLKLEKKVASDVEVVKVTYQEKKLINDFFISNKNPLGAEFKSIIGDIKLKDIFPYHFIPHLVWIDKNGVVRAFTGGADLNEKNIRSALTGSTDFARKIDMKPDVPTFMDQIPPTLQAISMLYNGRVQGLNSGNEKLAIGGKTRFLVKNDRLQWIYMSLATKKYDWLNHEQRIILNFNDEGGQFANLSYDQEKVWTFDFWLPDNQLDSLASYGIRFLNQYSGYFASAKKIETECYVLKYDPLKGRPLSTSGGKKLINPLFPPYRIVNAPLRNLISRLIGIKITVGQSPHKKNMFNIPIIDETGFTGNVDIELLSAFNSIDELNTKLKVYGLSLERTERILDMLVIDKL